MPHIVNTLQGYRSAKDAVLKVHKEYYLWAYDDDGLVGFLTRLDVTYITLIGIGIIVGRIIEDGGRLDSRLDVSLAWL